MKKALFIVAIVVAYASMQSCKHEIIIPSDPTNPVDSSITKNDSSGWRCSPDTVYFAFDVMPVFASSCAMSGCHDAISRADGYQLTDYNTIVSKGIKAGNSGSSKIYTEIRSGSMPPANSGITMTQAQKDIIAKWINQGAKNLVCNPNYGSCDTTNVKFAATIAPIVQNKCQGCHNASNPGGGIKLTTHAEIKASVQSGRFWGSIAQLTGYSPMPKGSAKLSTCELNRINAWIKAGALNN